MSAPQEPGAPRDSLIRAQFAPDARVSDPGDPARLALVLDNHDTVARLVRVELAGPLARFTRPRRQPRLELQSRRQQEITLEVRPEDTRPEGGHGVRPARRRDRREDRAGRVHLHRPDRGGAGAGGERAGRAGGALHGARTRRPCSCGCTCATPATCSCRWTRRR